HVFIERGKGYAEARPYPKLGNPWLKDLAPEDFAYRTSLTWPFSIEEYERRAATPFPGWNDIPGGNGWVKKVQEKRNARKTKEALPQIPPRFVPKDDAEAKRQRDKLSRLTDDL